MIVKVQDKEFNIQDKVKWKDFPAFIREGMECWPITMRTYRDNLMEMDVLYIEDGKYTMDKENFDCYLKWAIIS